MCIKHCARHSRDIKINKTCFQSAYKQVIQKKYHNRGANNVLQSARENQLCREGNISTEPWRVDRTL